MSTAGNQSILLRFITLAAANLVAAVFGFLVAALLAREFGPVSFGAISLATSIISYAIIAATLGTDLYAVRSVASRQSTLEQMIPTITLIRVALSTIVFLLLVIGIRVLSNVQELRMLIWLFGLTLFSNAILLIWVPQAMHRTHAVAACSALLNLLNFVILYGLLLVNSSIYMAPAAKIAADLLVAIGLLLGIRGYIGRFGYMSNLSRVKSIISECAPIGFTQLIRGIALASDLIILGLMSSFHEVGLYAAAQKLFLFLLSLGGAYFIILVPRLAALSESNDLLQNEVNQSLLRVVPVLIAALALVWFGAYPFLVLLFGDAYGESSSVLRVLALAAFAGIVFGHHRNLLLVKKLEGRVLKLTVASSAVHICSKIVLIPFLGILGCALGTLAGEAFLMIALWLAAKRPVSQ